ncbi:MAG TPA: hypothetical protein VGG39_06585 [Polyangiaceae bacterium]|jgi:hypothetical protein
MSEGKHGEQDTLPRELVWDGAHVSELAITAIADGQEAIVERTAVAHTESCDWCAGRLGRVALLAEAVGHAVGAARSTRSTSSRAPARTVAGAWRALSAGIAVAVLAGLPAVAHLGHFVSYLMAFFTRGVPVLARGGYALASSDAVTRALPAATLAASALLVVVGSVIARSRSGSFERSAS